MKPWLVALWTVAGVLQCLIAGVPFLFFAADNASLLDYVLAVFSLPLFVLVCQGVAILLVRRGRVRAGLWFAFGPLLLILPLMLYLTGFFH